MPLVCPNCGANALTLAEGCPNSTCCTECGQTTPANILPLFVVTGASGSGKTTVIPELRCRLPECVVFDKDLLWGRAAGEHFTNNWLRIAYSIAQGGRHTIICGTIMPWDIDACPDLGLVGTVHFLNLHCRDEIREQRLRERPPWRQSSPEFINEHKQFARWLVNNASLKYDPPMPTVDTSTTPVAEVASAIAQWVLTILEANPTREPACHSSSA